ncbi:MAG TPA: tetratricopeptide repeat protein [Luteolibacter sp.]|nr:tetratricopeptide repeat protein [Luteolibacter sp.]
MQASVNSRVPRLPGRTTAPAIAAALALSCASLGAASFNELKAAFNNPGGQPESAVLALLDAAIQENHPAQAGAIGQNWLKQNQAKNPLLLLRLGKCAELSGNWREAAAFYQQFLKQADPRSKEASDAILGVHMAFTAQLDDAESAYTFGRTEAERLAINPRFRQLDRWLLDQARQRGDLQTVAVRLLATSKSGMPANQFLALYGNDLIWLLDAINAVAVDRNEKRFGKETVDTLTALTQQVAADPELQLLLTWKIACKSYNLARINDVDMPAPIAQAKALLDRFPTYAAEVQIDWAGGESIDLRGDNAKTKFWPHQSKEKLQTIYDAMGKLSEADKARVMQTWSTNGIASFAPVIIDPATAVELTLNHPEWINQRYGPILNFEWHKLKPEDLAKLAPNLTRNPSPEAALIRILATHGATKDYTRMIDQLLGSEAWRLGEAHLNGQYADALGGVCGRPGGAPTRDQQMARTRQLLPQLVNAKELIKVPADKRLEQARGLWKQYQDKGIPTSPDLIRSLREIASITPQFVNELLTSPDPEAKWFSCQLLGAVLRDGEATLTRHHAVNRLDLLRYNPYLQQLALHTRSMDHLKTQKELYQAHPLVGPIRQSLENGIKAGKTEPWLAMAWLNARFPENAAQDAAWFKTTAASPVWKAMPVRVRLGARNDFGEFVLAADEWKLLEASKSNVACKPLLELKPEADAQTAAAAVTATTANLLDAPWRPAVSGLDKLGALGEGVWKDPAFLSTVVNLIEQTRMQTIDERFGQRLTEVVVAQRDPATLLRISGYLWLHVSTAMRTYGSLMALTDSLATKEPEVANSLARNGLEAIARYKVGHCWFKRDTDVPALKAIRGKCAMQLGLVEIPVAPDHPTYPIYLSQAELMNDNIDSAWKLVNAHWDDFTSIHRELSLSYLMWVLERCIEGREAERQEQLIKSLLAMSSQTNSNLQPGEKAAIEIAYGDIAMQRGQLRQAGEIFTRTEKNPAYKDLPIRYEAALRRVRVERISKNFDGALQLLADLEMERNPAVWSKIRFSRAEVNFDMEQFDDAKEDIDKILARDPDHSDALILLGKVQLKRQKLMEATEVELGSATSRQNLVPGTPLKVTLTDPTLAVSGAGSEIEVVVWANSGDREQFFLRQFGDQKTKFRGEISTALGAPAADDGTLQIIGDDEIFYAYSERFRKKMNQTDEKRGGPIRVASDGILMASSRKLLTEAEQRRADMGAVMDDIGIKDKARAEAAARAKLANKTADQALAGKAGMDFERYLSQVTKPGNPIHVRVIDPDRSRTANVDELSVSISSSSGDQINNVVLRETSTHSGWFEASVATTGAPPRAIARDSEPGRDPNLVISAGNENTAWRPIMSADRSPEFIIDLNDRAQLGEMEIIAREAGYGLRHFLVQTATMVGDWTTVAVVPTQTTLPKNPWQPSITVVNEAGRNAHYGARPVSEIAGLRSHLESGWLDDPDMAVGRNVKGPSEALPASVLTDVKWMRGKQWPNPAVVYRFKAYFHESMQLDRQFQLKLGAAPATSTAGSDKKQQSEKPEFMLVVNGRPVSDPKQPEIIGKAQLKPGIHTFEIWSTGWIGSMGFGREVTVLTRLDDTQPWEPLADDFFDPAKFPADNIHHRNSPATVTTADQNRTFKVRFAPDSKARLIRLLFTKQEGPAPAVNKISLTDAKGGRLLPLEGESTRITANNTLEILTGDRVSVRYQDDRFVTPGKQRLERFIDVAFSDADVEFADMEPRPKGALGELAPYYEKLLRFAHDKPISVVIRDADMDATVKPDTVKFKISTSSGGEKEFTATETGDSTGVFKLFVTPVERPATAPNEIQVGDNEPLRAVYIDQENNRPGIATERFAIVQHAAFTQPQFIIAQPEVTPYPADQPQKHVMLFHGFEPVFDVEKKRQMSANSELMRVRWQVKHHFVAADKPEAKDLQAVLGQPIHLDLIAPQYAMGTASTVKVYAQSESSRKARAAAPGSAFDITLPGTIQIEGHLVLNSSAARGGSDAPTLPSYASQWPWQLDAEPRDDRFQAIIPVIAGVLPAYGVLDEEDKEKIIEDNADSRTSIKQLLRAQELALVVKPGETIHIGFQYTAPDGSIQWITSSLKSITHPVFDIMDESYRQSINAAYAGEQLHLRVVDLGADVSDEPDTTHVLLQAKSGAKHMVPLIESGPHTGIFKIDLLLTYADGKKGTDPAYDVVREGMPVIYGDTLAARYTSPNGMQSETLTVTISKGADGSIAPFSKKYEDEQIAMRTQFSLAEAYLEMAKRHRQLGQHEQAKLEYDSATMLLSKAMDQFTDPDTRAHAEFLLGSMTMEEALVTENAEIRETRLRAALSRYMNVVGNYPSSVHAARAQFGIASIYEKLGEPEIAAQEYVKLAYKYPESEFLATSMARLGTHFLKKAGEYEAKAQPLLAKAAEDKNDKNAAFEGQAQQKLAIREYLKTASIFSRLQERFPSHPLAGAAGLRAGQAFMRAKQPREAIRVFTIVSNEQGYDGPTIRAQALYWIGMCQQELQMEMAAYSAFKRLTYDFPESEWAAYARAQLSQDKLLKLENKLELERLESGQ